MEEFRDGALSGAYPGSMHLIEFTIGFMNVRLSLVRALVSMLGRASWLPEFWHAVMTFLRPLTRQPGNRST